MPSIISRLLRVPWFRAGLYTAIWAALWFAPWGIIAPDLPWVRLAIGMVLFSVPGALTYDQLKGESSEAVELVVAGFAVSIGLTSVVGLIALIVHLPFWVVPVSLFVAGALQWVRVAFQGTQGVRRFVDDNRIIVFTGVVVAVLQIGLLTFIVYGPSFNLDDYIYGSYLIKWQTSSSLSFENALFNNGQIAPVRFRTMLFPMSQAVISDLSDIPDLVLVQVHLEPVLGVLSLLSVYVLARSLGLSSLQASLAVVFQGLVYLVLSKSNQVGLIFIERLSHDKTIVAFLLGPVVIAIVRLYLMKPSVQRWLLLLLVGVGMGLTHPTMAAVVVMIAGLYSLIVLVRTWDKTRFGLVVLALALSILWPAVFRFTDQNNPVYTFSAEDLDENTDLGKMRAERITLVGEEFVGFAPQVVEANVLTRQYKDLVSGLDLQDAPVAKAMLDGVGIAVPYIWLALAAITLIVALTRVRDDHAARYIVAASVVFLLALIPYTGWIIGKIITPWHLWRVPWHYPFGIGLAFLFGVLGDVFQKRSRPPVYKTVLAIFVVAVFAFCVLIYFNTRVSLRLLPEQGWEARYIRLQEIGEQLDRNIVGESAVVVGTPQINRFIPSISARSEVIWHRRLEDMLITGMSTDSAIQQRDDYRTIAGDTATDETRLRLMEKYHVKFMVIEDSPGWAARLLAAYPDRVRAVYEGENVIILSVTDPSPGS